MPKFHVVCRPSGPPFEYDIEAESMEEAEEKAEEKAQEDWDEGLWDLMEWEVASMKEADWQMAKVQAAQGR